MLNLRGVSRWLLGALGVLLFVHAVSAETDAQQDVVVWGLGLGSEARGLAATIDAFEQRHPEYKIRLVNVNAGRMNPQKLMTGIVGGVPPDLLYQDRFTVVDWASRGALLPLDHYIARDRNSDPLCPKPEQYYPAAWREVTYQNHVFAIPTNSDNRALYWNKQVFAENAEALEAAGLSAKRAPRTWEELIEYSKVLTVKRSDGTLERAGFIPNYGNAWLYLYSKQNRGSFLSEDGRECTLASEPNQQALKFILEAYEVLGGYENAEAFETGFLGQENDAFIKGQVAMKIDGNWILNRLSRYGAGLPFGVAPPPVPEDRYHKRGAFAGFADGDTWVSWSGGFSYAIPKGSENVEGAWSFIKFATSTEGRLIAHRAQSEWEAYLGRIYIPQIASSREANRAIFSEFMPPNWQYQAALNTHLNLMNVSQTRAVTPVGQALWDAQSLVVERAGRNGKPEQVLQEEEARVQRELDAFYSREDLPLANLVTPIAIVAGLLWVILFSLFHWWKKLRIGRLARTEAKWAYLFLTPWFVGFLLLLLGPMLVSLYFSFCVYDGLSAPRWVGMANYQELVGPDGPLLAKAFSNAAYLAGFGIPLSMATGLAIALLLNRAIRGLSIYRTLFYMPAIVPTVVSSVLWIWLLAGDPSKGLVNAGWQATLTAWFGISPPGWLTSEAWAKPALILMGMWGAGSGMILWLAGLKGISSEYYEAASIDGASPSQQFWKITLPQLSPIIFFNLVIGFIVSLQEFDRIYIMRPDEASAGPNNSLLVPVYHLYANGISYFKMGYASALAWIIFIVILVLTLIQIKLAPRWVHHEVDQ